MIEHMVNVLKILDWFPAGRVSGRLRLQKAIYLLQVVGVPAGLPYGFRHYGPYSDDLKAVVDQLRDLELVTEKVSLTSGGDTTYEYEPTDNGRLITRVQPADIDSYASVGRRIAARVNGENARSLELAATYFWVVRSALDAEDAWNVVADIKKRSASVPHAVENAKALVADLEGSLAP